MSDDPRVDRLLEELLDSGGTPEQVCRTCPELLPQVRAAWERLCALRAEIGALFPETPYAGDATPQPLSARELPSIRGYEVQEVLGHGGMGVVYKAWHQRLHRPVAIKMLLAGGYAQPQELERFLREAETVAGLRHANIVQVHEAGDVDGRPYFAMEFIEGGSLAESLAGMPLPARQAVALTARVAEAVHAAHQRGIVHRDLKPANILLTADGTPKITDFGLARRLEGATGLTQSGAPLGTPSYMAPEQAEGKSRTVGPAADTYAVGAILYELLTGRPPFRADSTAETLRQVIAHEPVPPCRLNATVPRDLQTICLKCLEKDPLRRYSSAQALAQDLHRFERNEPIVARPAGALERILRWTQRKPTAAALVATALALFALAIGGGAWLIEQRAVRRAELRSEVGTLVAQATSLRRRFHFHEARELLDQAEEQLGPAGPDDLRDQVRQARAELELANDLDTARMQAATPVDGRLDPGGTEPLYEGAFARAGLGRPGDDIDAAAARVRNPAMPAEVIAALDDWASYTNDDARREWLLAVARRADPDPVQDQLRQPDLWQDVPRLTRLVRELPADAVSPQLAIAVARVLQGADRAAAVPVLSAAQARFPQDFWLNYELGAALALAARWDESLSYYRAAQAVRPDVAVVHTNLGLVLFKKGRLDDAIRCYRQALRLDPRSSLAHSHLALVLHEKGQLEEAVGEYAEAIRLAPPEASGEARTNLGNTLWRMGRFDEAIGQYEDAIRLDPKNSATPHHDLGALLYTRGRVDEAIKELQESIRLDPKASAGSHTQLGIALRDRGQLEEAIAHFQQAVQLDPKLELGRQGLFDTRYAAACAAVRDSAGQGPPDARPGEQEQVRLRRQALDWLRADLELRDDVLKGGTSERWSLAPWQTNPALAGVCDAAALAKLPDAEREQWQRLWADVADVVAADPLVQGRERAARGDWARAADCYARALKLGATDDGHFRFEYAALLLLSGDRPGYSRACAHMIEKCGKADGPRAYHVARACSLAPDAVPDASLPGRLAEKELQGSAQAFWSLTEQGALRFRAGRFPEAVALFEQSLRAEPKEGRAVLNWLWLALAQQRVGKFEEARRWLDEATAWLDQYPDGMPDRAEVELGLHLHNWLEAHILRREAEALIRTPVGCKNRCVW